MRKLIWFAAVAVACGGPKSDGGDAPPARPHTGAPVAFQATGFKTGDDRKGEVDVRAYNFADKTVAQYWLLFRYSDASGNVIRVKQGTPFEKDHDFMSLSGKRFACQPKSWCSFKVQNLDVPAATAKVEVLAREVTAIASDGVSFEKEPLFRLEGMDWPAGPAAGAPPAPPTAPKAAEGADSHPGELPAECKDYKAVIEKLASCDKFPQAEREKLSNAFDKTIAGWETLPAEHRANLPATCKAGAEAITAAAKASCGW